MQFCFKIALTRFSYHFASLCTYTYSGEVKYRLKGKCHPLVCVVVEGTGDVHEKFCPGHEDVNKPPVVTGVPEGNLINLKCGETFTKAISFAAPEKDQLVTLVRTDEADGLTVSIDDSAQTATTTIHWTHLGTPPASSELRIVATDNGSPQLSATAVITLNQEACQTPNQNPIAVCSNTQLKAGTDCRARVSEEDLIKGID